MSTDWLLCRKCWIGHFATTQEVHQPLTKLDGIVANVLKLLPPLSLLIVCLSLSKKEKAIPFSLYLSIYLLLPIITSLILPPSFLFLSFFPLLAKTRNGGRKKHIHTHTHIQKRNNKKTCTQPLLLPRSYLLLLLLLVVS